MSSSQQTRGMPPPLSDRIANIRKVQDQPRSTPTANTASAHTRAHKIFERIKRCWKGQPVNIPPAATIHLRRSDYDRLLQLLSQNTEIEWFAFRRLKLFYNHQRRRLSYEMVTKVHDSIIECLKEALLRRFFVLEMKSEEAKSVVGLFRCKGSARITISEDKTTKKKIEVEPDAWYGLMKGVVEIPAFFVEVSFSQSLQAVREKVRKIIYNTNGRPGLALIIKLPYATPKQLANPAADRRLADCYEIFKWTTTEGEDGVREKHIVRLHDPREFRTNKGELVPGKLFISLRDLIGEAQLSHVPNFTDPAVIRALDEINEIDHSDMERWVEELESSARGGHLDLASDEDEVKDKTQDESLLADDDTVDGMRKFIDKYPDEEQEESDTSSVSATSSEKSEGSEFVPSSDSDSSGSNDS